MVITGHKIYLTTHSGHPEAVAVVADAFHHTADEAAHARVVGRAEAQAVERGDGAGAHGENIAVDTAHTGGSTLIGFDGRRVVVAFDFKNATEIIADVDQAGILFTGAHEQAFAAAGQGFELQNGVFVGTVLAPHHGVNTELGEIGDTSQNRFDFFKFIGCETKAFGSIDGYVHCVSDVRGIFEGAKVGSRGESAKKRTIFVRPVCKVF